MTKELTEREIADIEIRNILERLMMRIDDLECNVKKIIYRLDDHGIY